MTEVAEDDWMTAVTNVPSSTPLAGDDVSCPSLISSLPPATFLSESTIRDIPNRKKASPPSNEIIDATLIYFISPSPISNNIYIYILHYINEIRKGLCEVN